MTLYEAVVIVISLEMRGLLELPSWVDREAAEAMNRAMRTLNEFVLDEKERQMGRC